MELFVVMAGTGLESSDDIVGVAHTQAEAICMASEVYQGYWEKVPVSNSTSEAIRIGEAWYKDYRKQW